MSSETIAAKSNSSVSSSTSSPSLSSSPPPPFIPKSISSPTYPHLNNPAVQLTLDPELSNFQIQQIKVEPVSTEMNIVTTPDGNRHDDWTIPLTSPSIMNDGADGGEGATNLCFNDTGGTGTTISNGSTSTTVDDALGRSRTGSLGSSNSHTPHQDSVSVSRSLNDASSSVPPTPVPGSFLLSPTSLPVTSSLANGIESSGSNSRSTCGAVLPSQPQMAIVAPTPVLTSDYSPHHNHALAATIASAGGLANGTLGLMTAANEGGTLSGSTSRTSNFLGSTLSRALTAASMAMTSSERSLMVSSEYLKREQDDEGLPLTSSSCSSSLNIPIPPLGRLTEKVNSLNSLGLTSPPAASAAPLPLLPKPSTSILGLAAPPSGAGCRKRHSLSSGGSGSSDDQSENNSLVSPARQAKLEQYQRLDNSVLGGGGGGAADTAGRDDEGRNGEVMVCVVCGDKSSGKHYGQYTCEGCKSFFKRSIRRNLEYTCRGTRDCKIDVAQRNQCQYCRLEKCIKMGMRREAVQRGRVAPIGAGFPLIWTGNEWNGYVYGHSTIIHLLTRAEPAWCPNSFINDGSYGSSNALSPLDCPPAPVLPPLSTSSSSVVDQSNARVDFICELAARLLFGAVYWAKEIPLFPDLPLVDQVSLLQRSWCELLVLSACQRNIPLPTYFQTMLVYSGVGNDSSKMLAVMEQRRIFNNILEEFKKLRVDRDEFACLKALVLFNPETANLTNKDQVEQCQEKILLGLDEHCRSHSPGQSIRIYKLLLRLPVLSSVWPQIIEQLFFSRLVGKTPIQDLLKNILFQESSKSYMSSAAAAAAAAAAGGGGWNPRAAAVQQQLQQAAAAQAEARSFLPGGGGAGVAASAAAAAAMNLNMNNYL